MRAITQTLTRRRTSAGHFKITARINGVEYSTTTTNMAACDAGFDDDYDDEDNENRYYETQEEAREALVDEILVASDII